VTAFLNEIESKTMTRDEAKRLLQNIEFIKAFSEGKRVQHKNEVDNWEDGPSFAFTDAPARYRIVEPKLRPYNDDEAVKLAVNHPLPMFRHVGGGVFALTGYESQHFYIRNGLYSAARFLDSFTHYPSGQPCGVVE